MTIATRPATRPVRRRDTVILDAAESNILANVIRALALQQALTDNDTGGQTMTTRDRIHIAARPAACDIGGLVDGVTVRRV
ncbi:hypothetical protein [Rhodococcus koreensis]